MNFVPMNTSDQTTTYFKTLLYTLHGWGKTTQAKHYKAKYGKGFIISGEAGLSSVRSAGIDYLPFSSFDGPIDPSKGAYSFISICKWMQTPEFKARGYQWVMLDSLTELGDMVMSWATAKAEREAAEAGKKVNGFDLHKDYASRMIGSCKFIRDLPMQVVVSALAKSKEIEETGATEYWPMVQGQQVAMQIPGIFDHVFGGVTQEIKATKDEPAKTKRFLVTAKVHGWQGKTRDENNALKPVEETGSVIDLLDKIEAAAKKAGGAA